MEQLNIEKHFVQLEQLAIKKNFKQLEHYDPDECIVPYQDGMYRILNRYKLLNDTQKNKFLKYVDYLKLSSHMLFKLGEIDIHFTTTEFLVHYVLENQIEKKPDKMFEFGQQVKAWKRRLCKRWTLKRKQKVLDELGEIAKEHEKRCKILKPELSDTHHYDDDERKVMTEQYKKHLHFFKKACLIMQYI
jgi:hypothetical protein